MSGSVLSTIRLRENHRHIRGLRANETEVYNAWHRAYKLEKKVIYSQSLIISSLIYYETCIFGNLQAHHAEA